MTIFCFDGESPIPPVEAEQERLRSSFLYGQNVPMPQPSPKQLVSLKAGSLRQRGQQDGPWLPFPGHMHNDLLLLLTNHVLGQRSACEGAHPALEIFCSGGPSKLALFLHLWSSQRAAEDGGHCNTIRKVKSLLNGNYLKLLGQNPCDVAVAFKVQVVWVSSIASKGREAHLEGKSSNPAIPSLLERWLVLWKYQILLVGSSDHLHK